MTAAVATSARLAVSGTLNRVPWSNAHMDTSIRAASFTGMELTVLGTAASYPSPWRNVASSFLRLPGMSMLFDCGEGTLRQLGQCTDTSLASIQYVFITHLHGDHVFGLPGLLSSRLCTFQSNSRRPEVRGPPAPDVVKVFGPAGLSSMVLHSMRGMKHDHSVNPVSLSSGLPMKYHITELLKPGQEPSVPDGTSCSLGSHSSMVSTRSDGSFVVLDSEEYKVVAAPLKHTAPCYGYVVKETDLEGNIDVAKTTALGLPPSPLYRELKRGKTVTSPTGQIIRPEDVQGPSRQGRKIVILGDTCDSRSIIPYAVGCDILLHECTFPSASRSECVRFGHSNPSMAGEFARAVAARSLVLTHFSNAECATSHMAAISRVESPDWCVVGAVDPLLRRLTHPYPTMLDISGMKSLVAGPAQDAFQSECVVAARDFMRFAIPMPPASGPATSTCS